MGTGPIKPRGWCPHYGDICHVYACGGKTCVAAERAYEEKQSSEQSANAPASAATNQTQASKRSTS